MRFIMKLKLELSVLCDLRDSLYVDFAPSRLALECLLTKHGLWHTYGDLAVSSDADIK